MRKKTLSEVFDKIFWGFLIVLPLIMLIIVNVQFKYFLQRDVDTYTTLDGTRISESYYADTRLYEYGITYEVFSRMGLGSYNDYLSADYFAWIYQSTNPVFKFFRNLFSDTSGVLAIFNISVEYSNFWAFYFTWFVFIELLHLMVDVILFIPRACKKLLGRWSYE